MKSQIISLGILSLAISVFAESKMVLVKGGTFTMGSPATERQRQLDEKQHQVTLGDFYVDAYEVQQKDYEKITGKNPSTFKGGNLPVQNVTYYDAIEFCNVKSRAEGLQEAYKVSRGESGKTHDITVTWNRSANGYRLLTEAEWEYANRAGMWCPAPSLTSPSPLIPTSPTHLDLSCEPRIPPRSSKQNSIPKSTSSAFRKIRKFS